MVRAFFRKIKNLKMKKIELNIEVPTYTALASFYLSKNEEGKRRFKYMNKDRMKAIFKKCLDKIETNHGKLLTRINIAIEQLK